jgi:hypothetical protein
MSEKEKPRKNNVTHTRAIQRDRSQQPLREPPPEEIERLLEELVSPVVYAQLAAYRAMGLRQRILTLPVMVAFILGLIWRQVGSVTDAIRELNKHGILWARPIQVTQQAVSERLRTFPAELFHRILVDLLPQMHLRWRARQRPLPAVMAWAQQHFAGVWILDGSTLDALLRKVGLLREGDGPVLAGRMAVLLDALSRLPERIWYEEDSQAHDRVFWERMMDLLPVGGLLLMDLGFTHYASFDRLSEQLKFFVTRCKKGAAYQVERVLQADARLHDYIIRLGSGERLCQHPFRLVEIEFHGAWYRYLTNVLDPQLLSAAYVAQLYQQRWRIEDAFFVAKRLLGLAYFWVGSINGVQVQLWATWLFYLLLVDLTDRVAEAMQRPFDDISMQMVFKGLAFFVREKKLGRASDPVAYLVEDAILLGILKHRSRPNLPLTTPLPP